MCVYCGTCMYGCLLKIKILRQPFYYAQYLCLALTQYNLSKLVFLQREEALVVFCAVLRKLVYYQNYPS